MSMSTSTFSTPCATSYWSLRATHEKCVHGEPCGSEDVHEHESHTEAPANTRSQQHPLSDAAAASVVGFVSGGHGLERAQGKGDREFSAVPFEPHCAALELVLLPTNSASVATNTANKELCRVIRYI
jgi:hypothetical protein